MTTFVRTKDKANCFKLNIRTDGKPETKTIDFLKTVDESSRD